jgi:hypothetical protein
MMRRIVGLMICYMKYQRTHIEFNEKHRKKETLHNSNPQEEETTTLTVDSNEEDEVEVGVEVEDKSSIISAHGQDTWKGIIRTLVPLATIVTRLIMSSNIVYYFWPNSRRDEEETKKYN